MFVGRVSYALEYTSLCYNHSLLNKCAQGQLILQLCVLLTPAIEAMHAIL